MHARTGLVPERGRLGAWLVGPAGALLVRPGGPSGSSATASASTTPRCPAAIASPTCCWRCAADEEGFATVANLAFSGARWRVRRRLAAAMRPALDAGVAAARRLDTRAMP